MNRLPAQFIVLVLSFLSLWFVTNQVNWLDLFKIEQLKDSTEDQVGLVLEELWISTSDQIQADSIVVPLHSLLNRILNDNSIDTTSIQVHLIRSNQINAFALPGNQMVIYTGLITECKSGEELAGVLAHEIAHLEQGHVMQKLVREVGLGALLTLTGTETGSDVLRHVIRTLTSTAYDRQLESEADELAVTYLNRARIDPRPFADFLYLADQNSTPGMEWLSTHPESRKRAAAILEWTSAPEIQPEYTVAMKEWTDFHRSVTSVHQEY